MFIMERHRAMLHPSQDNRIELIDFGSERPPVQRLSYGERIVHHSLSVTRGFWRPNPGALIGIKQHTIHVLESEPFEIEWLSESGAVNRRKAVPNDLYINGAERPCFLCWDNAPRALVIALEPFFVDRVLREAFDGRDDILRTLVAVRDPIIQAMAVAWRKELARHGSNGRLFAESLGTALTIHVFATYGIGATQRKLLTGGLGSQRLRRVIDYIEAHLTEDIGLHDLATVAKLSPHHFSDAFKTSTGIPPHRYQIDRRIHRAKEMLLSSDQSITMIALDVGFASHSHFTDQFRKRTGTTPSRFRIDRK